MSGPELKPCGGCGETDPSKRCIGCLHDFGNYSGSWVKKPIRTPAQIRADALREAAARVSKMRILYQIECGRYDPTTGVTEYPGTGDEWISDMEDIEQAILALLDTPLSPTAVDNSPAPDAGMKGQDQ